MHLSPFHNMSTHLAKEIAISGDGISCTRSIQDFCHRQCLFFFLKKIQKLFDFILLQRNSEGTEKLHNVWKLFSITPIFPTIMTSFAPSPSSNASVMPIEFLHSYLHHYHIKCMENLFINVNQSYQFASKSDLSLNLAVHSLIQHSTLRQVLWILRFRMNMVHNLSKNSQTRLMVVPSL